MSAVTAEAQIANMALGAVGQRDLIDSLLEDTAQGLACNTYFATAKQKILEAHPWAWATKRQALALLSGVTREGYEYVHAAPADLLSPKAARRIEDGARPPVEPIPFLIELNVTGNAFVIASDVTTPTLVYTPRDVAVALWPASAIDALAAELAVRIALMLPVKPELARLLRPEAALKLREAMASDGNTGSPDVPPEAPWIRARK